MGTGESEPGSVLIPRHTRLLRDPWVIAALVWAVVIVVVYLAPLLDDRQMDFFTNYTTMVVWLILATLATMLGHGGIARRGEYRFWRSIGTACACWAAAEAMAGFSLVDSASSSGAAFLDCLYFLYYFWWLFALESEPHVDLERRHSEQIRNFAWIGRVLFALGLFMYFVLLPQTVHPELYMGWTTSSMFYISIGLYLSGRLAVLWSDSDPGRWRVVYGLLTVATLCVVLSDCLEFLYLADLMTWDFGALVDWVWYLPFVLIVLAARYSLCALDQPSRSEIPQHPPLAQGVPLLTYSFAFPVLHFSLHLFGRGPAELEASREVFILIWIFILGVLNLAQYHVLETWNRRLQARQKRAEERVLFLSKRDPLTGLLNRREFEEILREAISEVNSDGRLAVLFVDLDGFKEINDSLGHTKGDAVLQTVGARLQRCVRDTDSCARYGGDEFVLVLEKLDQLADAELVAQRVLTMLAEDIEADDRRLELTASIGISVFPTDGATPEELIDAADGAMYAAKAEGGARFGFAKGGHTQA